MFIKRVLVRRVKGKPYYSYRLIESEIVGGKRSQRTLLNLGAHYPIPKEDWRYLCAIINDKQTGQTRFDNPPKRLVIEAEHLIRMIKAKQRREPPDTNGVPMDAIG